MASRFAGNPICSDCPRKKGPRQASRQRCASCQRIEDRKAKQRSHDNHILETYGITGEQYRALLAYQAGKCAICCRASGRTRRLAVDHDHSCDQGHSPKVGCQACVRGLLCSTCNIFVGRMRDDPRAGDRMARYLRQPPWKALLAGPRPKLATAQFIVPREEAEASKGDALAYAFRKLIREVPTAHLIVIRVEGIVPCDTSSSESAA